MGRAGRPGRRERSGGQLGPAGVEPVDLPLRRLDLAREGDEPRAVGDDLGPLAVGPDEAIGHTVKEFHEAGATVLYVVVAVHVGAALWHHFVQKDTVLTRMLPQRG